MSLMNEELEAICNRIADGIASEADEQQLGELLQQSPESRRAYREFMTLHSSLHWDYVGAVLPEPKAIVATVARSASDAVPSRISNRSLARRAGVAFAGFLALTLLFAVGWFAVTSRGSEEEVVVVLTTGEELRVGQAVRIREGVAELRFACGATAVLQGPARLRLDSVHQVSLLKGAVSAVVPPEAVGFTVVAGRLKVVDLGTRFGVTTTAGGAAEVHVFKGSVQAYLIDEGGESLQTVTLKESEAVIAEPTATALAISVAELDAFAFDASLQRDIGGLIAPAINGGSSWEGWTLQGASSQLGIYGSGSTDDVYKIYTTVFTFDNHTVSGKPAGSAGFAPGNNSAGAFANGHTILGIGIERISGSPITTPTVKFDLGNDSYAAASSVGGGDGKTSDSAAHAGDFNTQYNYDQGNTWKTETLAVFDGLGKFDELTGNLVSYDYAFRAFAVRDAASNQTSSYQLFFDLDAMKSLYGPGNPGVGIGTFASELMIAINGAGSNHAVIEKLSIVTEPSRHPRNKK